MDRITRYHEVNLPFENMDSDAIETEELYEAVESAFMSMSGYAPLGEGEERLRAYRGSGLDRLKSPGARPYAEVDLRGSSEHSYLNVELNAPEEKGIEELMSDMEEFEENVESYWMDEEESYFDFLKEAKAGRITSLF